MAAVAALWWVGVVAVAVAVAVARISPPFPCAPALALLPIPFFKSSNRWDRGGMRGGAA